MRTSPFLFLLGALLALWGAGCGHRSKVPVRLPLPPASDSGLVNGEFLQVDYGMSLPVPAHWSLLRLSEDQEVDEVARLSDPAHDLIARVTVHLLDQPEDFSEKDWEAQCEADLKDRQLDLVKKGKGDTAATPDGPAWLIQNYRVADRSKQAWLDQEWVLHREDLLVWVHVTLNAQEADGPKGRKLLDTLQAALSKIHWYEPIGERGVSPGLYELDHFTADLQADLERGSLNRLNPYFGDLYPGKPQWDDWYKGLMADVPAQAELKVERTGLVINGKKATVLFSFTKKEKSGGPVQRIEKGFQLSKEDGDWQIVGPAGKN